ncbi:MULTISPECIES: site-specific integrase [unclassified Fusibacter]|uniref:tyrosine-type recombinase/integrase n=1 Tax=unclassified Fusibacter TaxID=2624464 RepID=UPI00101297FF|nr:MULTISPECIES: site-specific integrase [unclassified Fusibacter]MCK8059731.1 site-specific integrase [Fusibacter sp. A2]NPE21532.1 site-specific integrase [Fusibacter sp. A1]RXV61941.1 site-specific integrase [Fusibacter sp. A1]
MAKKTNYTKNGINYYRVTATIGFDVKGKRIRKEFLGKSKKEAHAKRDQYLEGINKGLDPDYDKVSFGELFESWLLYVHKPTLALSTYNRYETIHRHWIKPSNFYNTRLINLKSIEIQKHINQMKSPDTARRVYLLLSTFIKYCIKERLITYNPLDNVNLRKVEPREYIKYLSRENVTKLLNAFATDKSLFIYVFVLLTGIREGELCALTHDDLNFKEGTITIKATLGRVSVTDEHGKRRSIIQISPPKTKAGNRSLPIPSKLITSLKSHILSEKEKHINLGIAFKTSNFLFTSNMCTPLRGDHLNDRWKKTQRKLKIDTVVNFHGLRHTFCTILAEKNVPIKTAATLMGHSNIETTARVYTHVDKKSKDDAIKQLETIFR